MKKLLSVGIFLCVLLFIQGINSVFGCIEGERQALLKLKQSFKDPSNRLVSWTGEDCCLWNGVSCDRSTGNVVKLYLGLPFEGNSTQQLYAPEITYSLTELKHLESLDLSGNQFHQSPIPDFFGSLKNLRYLNLANAGFGGTIPQSLWTLSNMEELILSYNLLNGTISDSVGRPSSLASFDLSGNNLSGTIPQSIGRLSSLESLDLSRNNLSGTISESIGRLTRLKRLDLSENKLSGSVPVSLRYFANLTVFDISSNSFEGALSELHFSNLSLLQVLSIGSNHLSFKVRSDWNPPFSLRVLDMSSCPIFSQVPHWLQNQTQLRVISLSNSNISGSLPTWPLSGGSVKYLDLSRNQISGNLPENIFGARYLNLGTNLLNGSIPDTVCLYTMKIIDLSRNGLSGEIPECFFSPELLVLILSSNKLSGHIPSSIGKLPHLIQLHLNENSLDGELPLALRDSTYLEILDLGENKITGTVPAWLGESLGGLKVLRLRENNFSGDIPLQLCKLSELQILDLSLNNISGEIPYCFNNFTRMTQRDTLKGFQSLDYYRSSEFAQVVLRQIIKGKEFDFLQKQLPFLSTINLCANKLVGTIPEELGVLAGLRSLNLSHNHLSGQIPSQIGGLESIESLDLSDNQLFGEIPPSMAALMSLNYLNLSYNNLSGEIPTGNQLQTLVDPSIYAGNFLLCGFPLPKCSGEDEPVNSGDKHKDDGDDKKDKILFWFIVVAGYTTGLWGVIGTLALKKKWRIAYFRFADNANEWILVMVAVKVARLKQRMAAAWKSNN